MNELLRELLSMGPALGAGAAGNGNAMQAFMQGFQQSRQRFEQEQRLKQQDVRSEEDRQRAIAGQTTAEQQRLADRARAETVAKQQDFIRSQQAAGQMTETAAGFDDPSMAKGYVESMMPGLMEVFGQGSMALGQPAVDQATQAITGRQKKQVSDFLDAALKLDHVANNPDADPEITNLPEHIVKLVQKPSAKLSELQAFAQLPVGKPQGKTRIPAAPGSEAEFSDPLTTPERKAQILKDRRQYSDAGRDQNTPSAGDVSDVNATAQQLVDGFLVPSMLSRRGNYNAILAAANRLSVQKTGKPYNAARAQTEYAASQRFMSSLNGPQQQRFRALAGAVVNTIDEVKALSREMQNNGVPAMNRAKMVAYTQTRGNTPQGQLVARYIGAVNTLKEEFANLANGGYAPTEAAWALAKQQINGDFGVKQMDASLTEVQRLINFRMGAFESLTPYGVSPTNPAVEGMGQPSTGGRGPNPFRKPR